MRIRRKKHIDERLKNASDILIFSDFDIPNVNLAIKDKKYLDFSALFGNNNPVDLEIGCGKGGFIVEMAKRHPERNFIAVELLSNIIVMAAESGKKENLKNLMFFNCGADYLPRYIKDKSISNIYLNFSPPFPGDRYKNRRLTCDRLAKNYVNFLVDCGKIFQKTDDKDFYDFSFSQFEKFGFLTFNVCEKVKNGEIENVVTEYESKFILQGKPLYYLIAEKPLKF